MYPCFVPNETPIPKLVVVRFSNELQSVLLAMMHMVNTLFHLQDYLVMGKVGNVDLKMFGRLLSAQHSDASIKGYAANSVRGASSDEYRFVASFNQHSDQNPMKFDEELLPPMRACELLSQMINEELQLLWMNGTCSRPESLFMWSVPVSPELLIRPSVQQATGGGSPKDDIPASYNSAKRPYTVQQATGGGSPEDDIPVKLQEIIEMMRNIMHY
eukprot:CAMPEP_0170130418 /NCGR_PEP_ID=MMETSP0020_2-20130122/22579_1 /TAXON_ID=98059 /ORGANISM="Dinobryon sp., Strain UTEXLB2267" /LENGTH=214 /DNA_ID=CAMNT_0010365175 /DNA_START=265 /DNA_END=910 /DNA_ORIENTATION=-